LEFRVLDLLYVGAGVITIAGALVWPIRALLRRRRRRRLRFADQVLGQQADLLRTVAEFAGAALSAHSRVVTLGRLRASWVPVSEQTAVRLSVPLLGQSAPIAALRHRIGFLGNEEINRAADEVLHVLEESAGHLTKRKLALRRIDWRTQEAAIAEAPRALDDSVRQS
jgi:hypothetical protein